MSKSLFQDFEEISAKQWIQKIQYELKGEDYNQTLVTQTLHGVNIKPFYHRDETPDPVNIPTPAHWKILEKIYVASEEKSNRKAHRVLRSGAESLWFIIPSETIDLETLFRDIDLNKTPVYLALEFLSEEFLKKLKKYFENREHQVRIQVDIIGNLARSGNWFIDLRNDHEILERFISDTKFPTVLAVDSGLYQNAGATIPQELAYSIAHANEYLNNFSERKSGDFKSEMQFVVSTGTNYFFEIAKIRALRLLYATLASEYGVDENCHIIAQPTNRDKTLYDYNVNLLRTTTQCMSAVLGGADGIYNTPYDAIYHKNNKFGDRIARNQLLVLKNESYLDKVSNASEGTYYIETLTIELAEKALKIFKEIEAGGGFMVQLKEGVIQRKITESAQKEQEMFDNGELILVGTNKYQNPEDKMKNELELFPFLKIKPRKTLIQPILERRLAESLEKERLEMEQ
ncbi:MAG TPA: methylmalonyl-CoA mutase subunit beta [Gillisia sp.]|nr:methylmalonyl-CoA mutase subunit beta [Gillisia sp.]